MGRYTRPRNRGGDSSNDENLRGKYREAKKEIKQLHSHVKYLEKKLRAYEGVTLGEPDEVEVPESSGIKCKRCRSENVEQLKIPRREDTLIIWVCQDCGERESSSKK